MLKKWSVIWEFFCEDEDIKYTVCNRWKMKVPSGGLLILHYSTTNLIQYLSMKHLEIHKQYLERKASSEPILLRCPKKHEIYCKTITQGNREANEDIGYIVYQWFIIYGSYSYSIILRLHLAQLIIIKFKTVLNSAFMGVCLH